MTSSTITGVSPNRGQIHTEVYDEATGHFVSIYSVRSSLDNGELVAIIGTKENIPSQGAHQPPLQSQDFTLTAAPQESFDWNVIHRGVEVPMTAMALSLKEPSGTIVLDQQTGPAGAQGIHSQVENLTTGLGMDVVGLREFAMRHPGSHNIDFFLVVEVNSNDSFAVTVPHTGDTINTTNPTGWYDLYWSIAGQHTISETALLGVGGILTLEQGF
jgi:hypothetical protein